MKVLIVGDAVVSSGFARCTHALADHLHAAGHVVAVIGINYWGSPHPYPYPIYPSVDPTDGGRDQFGVTRLPIITRRFHPDIIVVLQDPWNIPAYLDSLTAARLPFPIPSIVGWLAVDSCNHHGDELNRLSYVIVWTKFGVNELCNGGYTGPISVVPLGVDLSVFHPKDRSTSRNVVLSNIPDDKRPPHDSFIVGVVGRNQPRKRLDLTIEYFADWVHGSDIDNAYLYLHTAPTGEHSYDIQSLVHYHEVSGRVIVATPPIGKGDVEPYLPYLYSSFDCYLTTSQAEGWGLPALEAMACGTPCVLPQFASFDPYFGWTPPGTAIHVPCDTSAPTAPMNGAMYTIGRVPSKRGTVNALNHLYRDPSSRRMYRERGLALAATLPWSNVGPAITTVLESVLAPTPTPLANASSTQPTASSNTTDTTHSGSCEAPIPPVVVHT